MEEEGVQFLPRETEENLPTDASSDFGNITYVRPSFQPAQVSLVSNANRYFL